MRIFGVAELARYAFSRFRQRRSPDYYKACRSHRSLSLYREAFS
jgi:hypothetical protein